MGIDIRKGADIACINCAQCVDRCGEIFRKKNKKGLINYFFGYPETEGGIIRQNVIITGLLTLLSMVFLIYLSGTRTGIDITVIPDYTFQPRLTPEGEVINSFVMTVENRQQEDSTFHIRSEGDVKIIPDRSTLRAGELKRTKVFIKAQKDIENITLIIETDPQRGTIKKEITLIKP